MKLLFLFNFCVLFISLRCKVFAIITDEEPVTKPPILTESIRWLLSQYAETRNKDKESQNEGYFLTPEERSSLFGTQDQSRPSRETDFTKCPPGATGSFPYPPDCKRFLNCWKGRGTVQVCAPGTLFNPEGNECDFPSKVKCADAKTFSNDHYPQPSNLHQQYVRFPNGRPPIARNPRLNPRPQNQERFTDDSDSVVIRPPPQRPPYFGPSHLTRPQQRPTTPSPARGKSPNPTCPKGATGLFSHPTDCGKFLNCWDGRTFVQDCGPGTVFNPLLSVCDHPHKVDCSAGKSSLPEVNKELDPEYIEGDYYRGSPSNINNRYDSNKGLLPDEDEGQMAAKEDDPRYNPDTNLYDNLWDNTNNQKGTNDQNTYQNNKNPRPNPYSPNVGNKLSDKYPTQKPYGSPTDQSPDGQRYGQDFGEDRITDEKNSKNPSRYPKPDDGYQPKRNKSLDYPSKPNPSPFKPEFDAYGNPINPHDHKPYHNHHHYHHHHLGPYPGNHGSYPPYNPNVQTSPNKPFPRYPDNPQGHYQPPSGQKGPYAESDKGQDDNNKPIIGNKPATEPAPYGHRQPHHFHPHPHHHPHHHHHHHPYDQKGDPKTKDENPYGGSKQPTPPSYGWTNPPSGQSHPHHHPNHFYNQYPPPQPYPSSYDQNKGNQKPDDKQSTPIPPYYGWINPQTGEHRPNPYDPNQESPYGPNGEPNNEGIPKNTNNQDPIPQIPSYGSKNPYDSNPNYGPNTQHGQIPPFYGSEQDPKRPNNSNSPSSPSYPPSGYPHLHPPYYENEKPGFPQTRPDSNPSKNPLPPSKTSKQFPPYPSKNPKHDEKDSNPNIDIRSDPKLFTTTPDYEEISQEVLHKPNPTTKPSWNKEVTTQPKEPNKKKAFPAYPGKDPYKSPNSNGYNQPTSKVPMTGELDKPDDDYDQLFDGSSKTIVTEKAPLKVKQTPPNGQKVRLRGGSSQLDGYLEIQNLDSKWGLACDKENGWNTDEASVACRELGFIRGAELSWQGYPVKSNMNELLISVNKIQCTGNEVSFSECNVTHTQRNECDVKRNAVGLRCYPNLASHCQPGEVHFNQRCYRLVEKENFDDIGPAFGDASDKCRTLGGSLVDITTQSENDFISEWLIKDHPHVNVVVTGGIGYSVAGVPIWTWHGNQGAILFEKWWHGWSGKKEIPMGKINDPLNLVLKKTYKCEETSEEEDDEDEQITALLPNPADVEECSADYFFWDIVDMKKIPELGYPFICERTMDDIGCVVGRGESYTGTANTTASGQPCLPWDHPKVIEGLARRFTPQERSAKLTGHNYCRNVGGDGRHPWCFIEGKGNSEFCAIPQCYDSVPGYSRSLSKKTSCPNDQYECRPGECIKREWFCDGQKDCSNGRDEEMCLVFLQEFNKMKDKKLKSNKGQKWPNTNENSCAKLCLEDKNIKCRSFSYNTKEKYCILSDSNIGLSGQVIHEKGWVYYERLSEKMDCTMENGHFGCRNGKCVNITNVCDGKNHCEDNSDEMDCGKLGYDIRLVGSHEKNKGRIEIKILGKWGAICDDKFDLRDADVVCRELGFKHGAVEVLQHSQYPVENPLFLVDDLDCLGNETSVKECSFPGWGNHNCDSQETVGVVCHVIGNECPEDQWQCTKSKECISIAYLCDNIFDCDDETDEDVARCNSPTQIRLIGGPNATSGRLEIRRYDIWGSICDDDFNSDAAKAACRILGYFGPSYVKKDSFFGPGKGPIWLDEVNCHGNETGLEHCAHSPWGQHNCKHDEDISIICTQEEDINQKSSFLTPISQNDIEEHNVNTEEKLREILISECNDNANVKIVSIGRKHEKLARVVGGSDVTREILPWQASVRVKSIAGKTTHWCGAVIISPYHVLTAAHCLRDYKKAAYVIRVGDFDTEVPDPSEKEHDIDNFYLHPAFSKDLHLSNDIALVKIKGEVHFDNRVKPACLAPSIDIYKPGTNCSVSGWGSASIQSSGYARTLRRAFAPILDPSICRAPYVYKDRLSDGMFCAGKLEGGVDSCQGDSGGPLICQYEGKSLLFGITSWGLGCGRPNKPGVYTNVAYYLKWIQDSIKTSIS